MALTTLDPETALVIVDLQKGVLGLPGTPLSTSEVLRNAVALRDAFREHGAQVVLVRVSATAVDGAPGRTEAPRRTTAPHPGWDEIAEELTPGEGEPVVTKRNWGAFYGTDLDLHLRRRGITQVVLAGVATSIGVESTARAAHEHGYHVTLAVDAMTDLNEDAHVNSVTRIFPRLGETGSTAEVIDLLVRTRG